MVRTKRIGLIAVLAIVPLALAGCVQGGSGGHPAKAHHTHPSTRASATPVPSSTPSATPTPGTVSLNCSLVLTANQVYAYNPNVVADADYTPAHGTLAASMAANSGKACGWINETSSVLLEVALELPPASGLATAKASAAKGTPTSASGADAAYFSAAGGVGTVQLFLGSYWIDISSADFSSGDDAQPIVADVVQNLRTAGG